jgi:CheY-like chemotaxis protein
MGRRVFAVVSDLLFRTRIEMTAAQSKVALTVVPADRLVASCEANPPDLVVLALDDPGDPVALARALAAAPGARSVPIVGFYPHVDQGLRERAQAAGVTPIPRSAFVTRMAEILKGP